ncbi:nucleotide sugar dehydrogenase [Rhodoligotrophos defluvii]|uniref:nucleotide sugar dehydrogenase n=1 Tax=Rhodoligotrophos defluvii TaxID=2561934 RepID=UPI0023B2A341|nr:nucleotide sugar dehydrogenase [Rhodoligotrophos defluvii]
MLPDLETVRIGVIGLGYVGLPLAAAFGARYPTLGYDLNGERIAELAAGYDRTREVGPEELAHAVHLRFTDKPADLGECRVHIVTVPTPIDRHKRPDLSHLIRASETVGSVVKPGDVVIYESTVYPGATEEDCIPVVERVSGLKLNVDFFAGYSPERINPGDRQHRLEAIRKVTSGSTPEAAAFVDRLYGSIIAAGTYRASSIRVAEAAKVIENTQRDLNIALVNELAIIFNRLGLDTAEVLAAAGTKWNFLPFKPGLVGGHCIGVDPYYLTHKAQSIGYHPEVILAGRRINDGMGRYVVSELIKAMIHRNIQVNGARVAVLGLAFKENCPDFRNSRVVDIIHELADYGVAVDVHDPWVDAEEARRVLGIRLKADPSPGRYDAVVLAVAHDEFRDAGFEWLAKLGRENSVIYDLKSLFPGESRSMRL